jgi:hypothetical protein
MEVVAILSNIICVVDQYLDLYRHPDGGKRLLNTQICVRKTLAQGCVQSQSHVALVNQLAGYQ